MSGLDEQLIMNDCPKCGDESTGFVVGRSTFMYSPKIMKRRNLKYSLFVSFSVIRVCPHFHSDYIKCQNCHTEFSNDEGFYRHTKLVFDYVVKSGEYYKTIEDFRKDVR